MHPSVFQKSPLGIPAGKVCRPAGGLRVCGCIGAAGRLLIFSVVAMAVASCAAVPQGRVFRFQFSEAGVSAGIDFSKPVEVIPDGKAVAR